MRIVLKNCFLLTLFLGATLAHAHKAHKQVDCDQADKNSKFFRKFDGISDAEISSDCTYDGKMAPSTADCVKGFKKMRELSAEYLKVKKDFCQKVASCKAEDCPGGMDELAKETEAVHKKVASLLSEGRKEIKEFLSKVKKHHHKCKSDKDELDKLADSGDKGDKNVWKTRRKKKGWKKYHGKKKKNKDKKSVESPGGPINEIPHEEEEEIASGISGAELEVIDAGAIGAADLAEYRVALPRLLNKQERALEKMAEFEKEIFSVEEKHEAAAAAAGDVPKAVSADTLNTQIRTSTAADAEETEEPESSYVAVTGLEAPVELVESEEELVEFSGSLDDDSEPSRLKDSLRKMLEAKSAKQKAGGATNIATNLVAEVMAEQYQVKEKGRKPASVEKAPGLGPVDVAGAYREIEYQLADLDRSRGILGPTSLSLFERVKQSYTRFIRRGRLDK